MTEMEKALQADGEKLLALTGEDHGPFDQTKDEVIAQMSVAIEDVMAKRDGPEPSLADCVEAAVRCYEIVNG